MSNVEKCKEGVFLVRVMQRQHHTWQGTVTWVEKEKTATFKSALELIMLVDQATAPKPSRKAGWQNSEETSNRKDNEDETDS